MRVPQITKLNQKSIVLIFFLLIFLGEAIGGVILYQKLLTVSHAKNNLSMILQKTQRQYEALKNQDQYKINQILMAKIQATDQTATKAASVYEKLADLRLQIKDTSKYDNQFAQILNFLATLNYSSASASIDLLAADIQQEQDKLAAASVATLTNVPSSNNPPGSGFSQQAVTIDEGSFVVDLIAADLNSIRVIVDTASSSDCSNNCPVLPLDAYVGRSGAFAGINGTFFCPSDYPSCAGKTGSFDTLLMNKNKYYFNSANNVYSTVPLVYFAGNQMGVRSRSEDWGRDTGVDSVIAMQPLLVQGGSIVYAGSGDAKFVSSGSRGFIANKGSTVYIGDVINATMEQSAKVLKALGMDNALNLDEGGSTALWYGGYKLGPGRNIPNAILFVRK